MLALKKRRMVVGKGGGALSIKNMKISHNYGGVLNKMNMIIIIFIVVNIKIIIRMKREE